MHDEDNHRDDNDKNDIRRIGAGAARDMTMAKNLSFDKTRRTLTLATLATGAGAMTGLFGSKAAHAAAAWPSKQIRLVVPFAPGGPTDVAARLLAQKLGSGLGQTVIIDNKPGAGGTVGAANVALSPADGYTLLYGSTSTLAVSPALYAKLPYDPAAAFASVALVAKGPQMLVVNPDLPVKTFAEFVAYAKKNPGKLSFSSAGNGSIGHLTGEFVKSVTGIDAVHIPYKGGSPAVNAVMAGETQFTIDAIGTMSQFVKADKLRALVVLGDRRSDLMPDLQTAKEAGYPTLIADFWSGVVAPAGTPNDVIVKLAAEIATVVADPVVIDQLKLLGTEPQKLTVQQFSAFVKDESRKWQQIALASGVKPE
jgi:tripartite-type tricarboxylate transporter receptor subunit TctC